MLRLLAALAAVESHNNADAVNYQEQAFGILQTRRKVVEDVNRVYGTHYSHVQMFDAVLSHRVAQLYLEYWGSKEMLGHEPTYEDLARIWNGGPDGWYQLSTLKYWEKVQHELQRQGFADPETTYPRRKYYVGIDLSSEGDRAIIFKVRGGLDNRVTIVAWHTLPAVPPAEQPAFSLRIPKRRARKEKSKRKG